MAWRGARGQCHRQCGDAAAMGAGRERRAQYGSLWMFRCVLERPLEVAIWPRGPMDKASAHGAGDCRFEPCRGHLHTSARLKCQCQCDVAIVHISRTMRGACNCAVSLSRFARPARGPDTGSGRRGRRGRLSHSLAAAAHIAPDASGPQHWRAPCLGRAGGGAARAPAL